MGVRTFQAPCSPHSRCIDSVRPATEQPNLTLSITGSNAGVNGTLHTPTHNLPHCLPPHSASLPALGYFVPVLCVYARLFVCDTSAPSKKTRPCLSFFQLYDGESPTQIPVALNATNVKFNPEVPSCTKFPTIMF